MSRLWPIALLGAASLGCQAILVPDELDATTASDWRPYPGDYRHATFRGRASVAAYVVEGAPP